MFGRWGRRGRCTRGWKTVGFELVVACRMVREEEEGLGLWREGLGAYEESSGDVFA